MKQERKLDMQTKDLDVVYILKDTTDNEELWYSLRSVEKNLACRRVFFVGGKPVGLEPDFFIEVAQDINDKWKSASNNIKAACECKELSENFILFNDDFFVMKYTDSLPVYTNGTLNDLAAKVTKNYTERNTYIEERIYPAISALKEKGLSIYNFDVHVPMIINKAKMLEVYKRFPDTPAKRSLYGNLYNIKGVEISEEMKDGKIQSLYIKIDQTRTFISTTDASFLAGEAGKELRQIFNKPSRFEDFYYRCLYGR